MFSYLCDSALWDIIFYALIDKWETFHFKKMCLTGKIAPCTNIKGGSFLCRFCSKQLIFCKYYKGIQYVYYYVEMYMQVIWVRFFNFSKCGFFKMLFWPHCPLEFLSIDDNLNGNLQYEQFCGDYRGVFTMALMDLWVPFTQIPNWCL